MTTEPLKPVNALRNTGNYLYRENFYAQNILLKALADGITDPKELRKIAGLRSVTDVYRTLDKMAMRKEYHEALSANGISLSYIINGIRDLCDNSRSDSVRLLGFQTFLKSMGLDKYEKTEDAGKNWEEVLIQSMESSKKELKSPDVLDGEYVVRTPEIPVDEQKERKAEKDYAKELYEGH